MLYPGELRATFGLTYLFNENKIRDSAHKVSFFTISDLNPNDFKIVSYICLVVGSLIRMKLKSKNCHPKMTN